MSRKIRWAPNQLPLGLLKCGCVCEQWPAVSVLGKISKLEVWCELHEWQYVKRDATLAEYEQKRKGGQDVLF